MGLILKELSIDELKKIRDSVVREIRRRNFKKNNKRAESRLWNALMGRDWLWSGKNYESELKRISEQYTKDEFSHWSYIGKVTTNYAVKELRKRGLKFRDHPLPKTNQN